MFLSVLEAQNRSEQKATPMLQLLVLLVFFSPISFRSIPFLVPGGLGQAAGSASL